MSETEATAGALPVQRSTLLRAALLGGAILAMVAAAAWLGGQEEAASPIERFQRLGPAGAAAALKAELVRDFPPGTPVTPLVQRLQGLGLNCTQRVGWDCALAFRAEGQRSVLLRATVAVAGERILNIETAAESRS
ncbi:hypothetical protein JMJ56_17160 [Belnapia sp. T18]|uniref:Uncharacterized protein n=1 Tax=Belnapia arida TaxID=2804533 RepID=A0ABS1U8Y5_9PROT|nr:hypothetical protein [Belnapia arida]MBL6079751.1 hypothetical protein [Belnapia arida]